MRTPKAMGIALIIAMIAARVVGLGQYPVLNPDEGFWASGPRNFILYGDGLMDGRLHPFLSPATFASMSGWFSVLAPNLVTARLFSVAAGLLTCALVAVLSRRFFPARPWLPLLLFGFSSLTLLIHRVALLEAHQTLWLVLAATLWLSRLRGAAFWAGVAYGIALLVKSNSLYLLPAFLLTLPGRDVISSDRSPWAMAAGFLLACGLAGGGGYLAAWSLDPVGFATAFRYELDGQHFLDEGVLFHVGRFGLHPDRLLTTVGELLLLDPLLLALALAGLVLVARQPPRSTRADRFFAAWVLLGLAFHLGQVYVEVRYFSTLAPALAYLAARSLDRMLDRTDPTGRPRSVQILALMLILVFCGYNVTRIARGVRRQQNAGYWQVVAWVSDQVPRSANVMAAPSIGLSLPQRNYDFYRLVYTYDGPPRALAPLVERYDIAILIVDAEWHAYATPDSTRFIAQRCLLRVSLAGTDIYEVTTPDRLGRDMKKPLRNEVNLHSAEASAERPERLPDCSGAWIGDDFVRTSCRRESRDGRWVSPGAIPSVEQPCAESPPHIRLFASPPRGDFALSRIERRCDPSGDIRVVPEAATKTGDLVR